MNDFYRALIHSDRVSSATRALLLARAAPDDPQYQPRALDIRQIGILRAMLGRVLPKPVPGLDLAARLDKQLADGPGDGWRAADLPPDIEAYQAGLDTLAAADFTALDPAAQDALLTQVAAGALLAGGLTGRQMQLWFEDVRADAVRIYVSHPGTMEQMGYAGFANGGDGEPKSGFHLIGIGDREEWEPVPAGKPL